MAYIERSLGRYEILLHRARLAWLYPAGAWSALIVFLSLSAAAYAYELRWLAAVAALAGLALFLVFMVPVWSTEIGVTNQRFIFKTGLLRWSSDELQLDAVEEVRLEQGLLGRLLNYGCIEVRGTGVANIRLPSVDDPVALRRALLDAMDRHDRPSATGPPNVAKSNDPIEQRALS
jgi:uncharacterized membrane protein YdbT with pleckstrin-like domain